jgi:N-acetyl-anhydromuramyl-L-alanine amidase AmpD
MMYSELTDVVILSPNRVQRASKVCRITPHVMAADQSVEVCGAYFRSRKSKASSNYGIDSQGRIACYVPEDWRSQCSDNWKNDEIAITIEIANDGPGPEFHVSDKALAALADLCEDICRRHEFRLDFTGDMTGNVTLHKWFVCKPCPGPYIESKLPWLQEEVNRRLEVAV